MRKSIEWLSEKKKNIPREIINRFIRTATQKIDLVWSNPILSNIYHDIILFASTGNILNDATMIKILVMLKKVMIESPEQSAYIQSIFQNILKSSVALQPRSLTKNNIMTIARNW
jgi:hypothetical protein